MPAAMADFTTPIPGSTGAVAAAAATTGSEGVAGGLLSALKKLFTQELWKELFNRLARDSRSFFNVYEFSRPASQGEWITRVSGNASRFAFMYGLFFLPIMLHTMNSSWSLRIGSLAVAGVWGYAYGMRPDDATITCFGISLPKVVVCACVSVVVMLLTGMLNALIGALFVFSVVAMPHMSLHTAAGGDAIDALEMQPVMGRA